MITALCIASLIPIYIGSRKFLLRTISRNKMKKVIMDMHEKCTYVITQEFVHDRTDSFIINKYKSFYKRICEIKNIIYDTDKDLGIDNIKKYGDLKREFYNSYIENKFPWF